MLHRGGLCNGAVYHPKRHSASEKRSQDDGGKLGIKRRVHRVVSAESRLRCAQSGEWRAASNIISCAWAQVTTRASAGRTHHGLGAVRLRAGAYRGLGGIGAAPGRAGRRRALLFWGHAVVRPGAASAVPTIPPSGHLAATNMRRWAYSLGRRRARCRAGTASCGECKKVVEVWYAKSDEWRAAGNIISCTVRLRASSSGLWRDCWPVLGDGAPPVWGAGCRRARRGLCRPHHPSQWPPGNRVWAAAGFASSGPAGQDRRRASATAGQGDEQQP